MMALKNQKISKNIVKKMKDTQFNNLKLKYKWDDFEEYMDINLDISSRNRNKKFITLREFKGYLDLGYDFKKIREITSKHLIQFYSNLLQGKITLSKQDFIKEYNKGLSLDDICKKYKISRDNIIYLRQLYGEKSKGAKYINRKNIESPLSQRQKEILYGSMMGDAKKMSQSSVGFVHGESQKDYLLWKYNEFKNVSSEYSLKGISYIDKRSEFQNHRWSFYTYANTDIEKCISLFYNNGQKEVSKDVLKNLTPLSIAVFYMDDGKVDWHHRKISKDGYNYIPIFEFCSESFSKESCENIKEWFDNEFNIKIILKERVLINKIGYRLRILPESVKDFVELIKPYILPMFYYKIEYNDYLIERKKKESKKIGCDVLKCPLGGDFSSLSLEEQDNKVEDIVNFYQEKSIYFLLEKDNKWEDHMNSVFRINPDNLIKDGYISFSNLGNNFLMSHFPNFWEAHSKGGQSPKDIFENKEYLSDIIRKIIINGYFPSKEKILKSLQRYRGNKKVSGFMPCVSKSIYHKYCDENSRIFDFCAGYGGRLFGAYSCNKVKSYTCAEVNFKTYSNLCDLHETLRIYKGLNKEINIFNQDSILSMNQFSDKVFDFCFTSPPYFNSEIYSDDSSQSCFQYNNYNEWFNKFLIDSIKEAMRISKKVAINVANTGGYMIANDLEIWFNDQNISYMIDKIRYPQYGGKFRYEPIYVF